MFVMVDDGDLNGGVDYARGATIIDGALGPFDDVAS